MKYQNRTAVPRRPQRFVGRLISTSLVVGLAAWSLANDRQMAPLAGTPHRTLNLGTQVPIDSNQTIQVGVVFNVDVAGLQAFVDQVSDPASPFYRQYLTPEEVGAKFGATQADVNATVQFLQESGLTVTSIPKNHTAVFASGTVSQVEQAFRTTLTNVRRGSDGTVFHTNLTQPYVPLNLVGKIHGIRGLDTARRPKKLATTTLLNPTFYRAAYNDDTSWAQKIRGQGRNIAIANWDGFRLDNLPIFYAAYGLPLPTGVTPYTIPSSGPFPTPTASQMLNNVTVEVVGGGGAGSGNPVGEGDLDMQNVLQVAPLCNLNIYDDNDQTDGNAPLSTYTKIADDNTADIVTESYSWPTYAYALYYPSVAQGITFYAAQYFGSEATEDHMEHLAMSAQGITYLAASGDQGANEFLHPRTLSMVPANIISAVKAAGPNTTQLYEVAVTCYPAIDPEVLVVGGSIMTVDATTGLRVSEASWGQNSPTSVAATGGYDVFDSPFRDNSNPSTPGWESYIGYDTTGNNFTMNTPPTYQKTYIPSISTPTALRVLPDIVSAAGGQNGLGNNGTTTGWAYTVVFNKGNSVPLGSLIVTDGTSCSSPAAAGSLSIAEQRAFANVVPNANRSNVRLGRIADYLYSLGGNPNIFNDITTGAGIGTIPGSTTVATPGVGWDFATGWGSINWQSLGTKLINSPPK